MARCRCSGIEIHPSSKCPLAPNIFLKSKSWIFLTSFLKAVIQKIESLDYNLALPRCYCLKRWDLLLNLFALALWALVFPFVIVGNRNNYTKSFFTFFTIEFISRHNASPIWDLNKSIIAPVKRIMLSLNYQKQTIRYW